MRSNSMPLIGFALGSSFISLAWHRSAFAEFSRSNYMFLFSWLYLYLCFGPVLRLLGKYSMYETITAEFFEKTQVKFEIYDIDQRVELAVKDNRSILSCGVDLLNGDLASITKEGDNVLEVGCGRRSYFREIKPDGVNWFGLDVYKFDGEGRSIVTEIGSVHDMPMRIHLWILF